MLHRATVDAARRAAPRNGVAGGRSRAAFRRTVGGVHVILSYASNGAWTAALGRGATVEKLAAHYLAFELSADGSSWTGYDYYVSDARIDANDWIAIQTVVAAAAGGDTSITIASAARLELAGAEVHIAATGGSPGGTTTTPAPGSRLPPFPSQASPINRLPAPAPVVGRPIPQLPGRLPIATTPPQPTPRPLPVRPGTGNGGVWIVVVGQLIPVVIDNAATRPVAPPTEAVPRIMPPATLPPILIPIPFPPPLEPDDRICGSPTSCAGASVKSDDTLAGCYEGSRRGYCSALAGQPDTGVVACECVHTSEEFRCADDSFNADCRGKPLGTLCTARNTRRDGFCAPLNRIDTDRPNCGCDSENF